MSIKNFIKEVFSTVFSTDCSIKTKFRFSQSEVNEILANSLKCNLPYFEKLAQIKGMSAFDISYLMATTKLDDKKIELICHAGKMFDEKEFCAQGQTFSDFIFRVCANINMLSEENLDVFKELVQCKNELYDFSNALKNPARACHKSNNKKLAYAFQTVFVD